MTPERLAEIKARAEAATAGPWAHDGAGDIWSTAKPETREQYFGGGWSICTSSAWRGENDPDIAFIANARQDIPDLVAEVEQLQATAEQAMVEACEERCAKNRALAEPFEVELWVCPSGKSFVESTDKNRECYGDGWRRIRVREVME